MSLRRSTLWPFKATLTEENLPDQSGKVFMVTGGSAGVGKELVSILYQHNAKIYIAARSEERSKAAIDEVKAAHPDSRGELVFLSLQLDDLATIKGTAEAFLAREPRLDVLWNNAGVMVPPQGSKTAQGYELQLGVNNLGHFLLTALLRPALVAAAKTAPKNSVRVVWVSSSGADGSPKGAFDFDNMDYHRDEGAWTKYFRSKAGNVLHAMEFARKTGGDGIISLTLNPGNLMTDLQRHMTKIQTALFKLVAYRARDGAHTELFAGLDPSITEANNGGWVSPFGRIEEARKDLTDPELGKKFWDWSEEQVKPYL